MSNDVYGFVRTLPERQIAVEALQSLTNLGVRPIPASQVFGFAAEHAPKKGDVCFLITDGPKSMNATYLVDGVDYAPRNRLTLPAKSVERLALLAEFVQRCVGHPAVELLAIAVTDSSYVEDVVQLTASAFEEQLVRDVDDTGPPDRIYLVRDASADSG